MNCKIVVLLVVFSTVMLVETDAWRIRIRGRRLWNRIKKPLCRTTCSYGCSLASLGSATPVCGLACNKLCGRKRRAAEDTATDEGRFVIPLPSDFHEYDDNQDGVIQLEEFADFCDLAPTREDVKEAFNLADSDDDSVISQAEFQEAPWVFE